MSGALGLVGEEYFKDPWKNLRDVLEDDARRVIVDMPPQLSYDREPIPLHVLEAGKDLHLYSVSRSGVVALVDEPSGQVRTGFVGAPPPPREPPGGFRVGTTTLDLRRFFAISRAEQRYLVSLVIGPYCSGPLPLELTPPDTEWRDPEIAAFRRSRREKHGPQPISATEPGGPLRWTEPRADASPSEPPAEPFIAMQAPRVILPSESPEAILEVRFRLPVHSTDVFPAVELPGSAPPSEVLDESAARKPRAVAGVPITLLIVDSVNDPPKTVHLHVPVYRDLEPCGDDLLGEGSFEFDLLAVASRPRTYFVYAISGRQLAGPTMLGVVDESRLPPM